MFQFRIIETPQGQVIDQNRYTSENSLTVHELGEYITADEALYAQKLAEKRQKRNSKPRKFDDYFKEALATGLIVALAVGSTITISATTAPKTSSIPVYGDDVVAMERFSDGIALTMLDDDSLWLDYVGNFQYTDGNFQYMDCEVKDIEKYVGKTSFGVDIYGEKMYFDTYDDAKADGLMLRMLGNSPENWEIAFYY